MTAANVFDPRQLLSINFLVDECAKGLYPEGSYEYL